nr:hypothetical protein [Tanacetum cinerariifolium]
MSSSMLNKTDNYALLERIGAKTDPDRTDCLVAAIVNVVAIVTIAAATVAGIVAVVQTETDRHKHEGKLHTDSNMGLWINFDLGGYVEPPDEV